MLSHLGLNVPDLAVAADYYNQLLPLVGYEAFLSSDDQLGYRADGRNAAFLFFYRATDSRAYSRDAAGLQHVAFAVRTRDIVHQVHALVVALGSTVLEAPRAWPEYMTNYYATFWLDPFGFKLEAVSLGT